MATVREIRKKLTSVHNIKKITQAMEMVAGSRLRRAQAKAEMSRPYARKLKELLDNIFSTTDQVQHPLVVKREVKKTAFVIIAGDRGLCGGYNQTVFSTAEKLISKYDSTNLELVLVGSKTMDYFSRKKWPVSETISNWGGKITYPQIEALTNRLMQQFLTGQWDEIWIIYTHYVSLSARKVVVEKFLNIDLPDKVGNEKKSLNYIFEPNVNAILADILPRYCVIKMQSALDDSYASELAARIFSMRAATSNAEEMIEKLTLVRNKVRQAMITRELIEITTGAESLN